MQRSRFEVFSGTTQSRRSCISEVPMQIDRRANFHEHFLRLLFGAFLSIGLTGCATPQRSDPPQPFDQAVATVTDALLKQAGPSQGLLPFGPAQPNKQVIVLDPTLDAGSGQQTAGTQRLDRGIAAHAA